MQVTLTKAVNSLGLPGDVVNVSNGYARNYLIPQGFAVMVGSLEARQALDVIEGQRKTELLKQQETAQILKKSLLKPIHFIVPASKEGTLFQAISVKDIATKLGIDQKYVIFTPTKALGSYQASVVIGTNPTQMIDIIIEAENSNK